MVTNLAHPEIEKYRDNNLNRDIELIRSSKSTRWNFSSSPEKGNLLA